MLLVGELINSTRKSIEAAISNRDEEYILNIAGAQIEAGADYVELNAGTFYNREAETIEWMVKLIKEKYQTKLCIDSSNPEALSRGVEACDGNCLVNSISLNNTAYDVVLPILKKYDCEVVALCMGMEIPESSEERINNACVLVDKLNNDGIKTNKIFIDPLMRPLSIGSTNAYVTLKTIEGVRNKISDVHITCGLSNASFGLPKRFSINRALVAMAMWAGMDSAILNPRDPQIMGYIKAAEAIMGKDEYCLGYIEAVREGKLEAITF